MSRCPVSVVIISIVVCGWLAPAGVGPRAGDEKTTSPTDAREARVFDVLKYGAVGDGKTDNTEAFSACLKGVVDAGGGRMVLPAGVYCGRIIIPAVEAGRWISLEIVGESQPASIFGTVGRFDLQHTNTIVKCLATSGPAVISAVPTSPQQGNFSGVHAVIRDLEVRTYSDPQIGGIDLQWVQQCRIENVIVNTGVYNVQASSRLTRQRAWSRRRSTMEL